MSQNDGVEINIDAGRREDTQIAILDDDTEEMIGEFSGISPPIPQVGDLVSLTELTIEGLGPEDAEKTADDSTETFRVADRAVHYFKGEADYKSEPDAPDQHLTSQVVLYVVSQEEWHEDDDEDGS